MKSIFNFRHTSQLKIKCSQCGYSNRVEDIRGKCYRCNAAINAKKELVKK